MTGEAPANYCAQPPWDRPFDSSERIGWIRWDHGFAAAFDTVFHACHEDELVTALRKREIFRGSKLVRTFGIPRQGTWFGLNIHHLKNRYGPFVMEIPTKYLIGTVFDVFKRDEDRTRYSFVERRVGVPNGAPQLSLDDLFEFERNRNGEEYTLSKGAICDFFVRRPLLLDGVRVVHANHASCISKKCAAMTSAESSIALQLVARREWHRLSPTKRPAIERLFPLVEFPCE